jgi:hypothetical protein
MAVDEAQRDGVHGGAFVAKRPRAAAPVSGALTMSHQKFFSWRGVAIVQAGSPFEVLRLRS